MDTTKPRVFPNNIKDVRLYLFYMILSSLILTSCKEDGDSEASPSSTNSKLSKPADEVSACNPGHVEVENDNYFPTCVPKIADCSDEIQNGEGQMRWDVYLQEYGECEITKCSEHHVNDNLNLCVPRVADCSDEIQNGYSAYKRWDVYLQRYGECKVTKCGYKHYVNDNTCVPEFASCFTYEGRLGWKEWSRSVKSYGRCYRPSSSVQ